MLPSPLSGDQRIILAVRRQAFGSYIFIYSGVMEKPGDRGVACAMENQGYS